MTQRIKRINELIKQELGRLINKEIELPKNSLVTITKVKTTPDLKIAKIFITTFPDKFRGTILNLLNKKARHLHELIKSQIETKFVPNLKFIIDEQELFANQVEQILDEINKE